MNWLFVEKESIKEREEDWEENKDKGLVMLRLVREALSLVCLLASISVDLHLPYCPYVFR